MEIKMTEIVLEQHLLKTIKNGLTTWNISRNTGDLPSEDDIVAYLQESFGSDLKFTTENKSCVLQFEWGK